LDKTQVKVKIFSLGCRLNQYEIESVSTALQQQGALLVQKDEEADFCIINSCVVTQKSEAKTRNLVYRSQKKTGSQKTIVTGCFAKILKKDENTLYLPNDYKHFIPYIMNHWEEIQGLENLEPSRFKYNPPIHSSTTRVNVKIQDGCDEFCSYCIIPLVRGKPQSRPLDEVLTEIQTLVQKGFKELVITGITIGKYQWQEHNLASLLKKALALEGNFRLHLSSLDPHLVSPNLLEVLNHPQIVKHLHLSLQSGSNQVLKNMNRKYTQENFLNLVSQIRKIHPLFNLTTDIITGFPGETYLDHQETLKTLQKSQFTHVHTFRYSPRPLTAAADFSSLVDENTKKEQSLEIVKMARQIKRDFLKNFHGQQGWFLGEKKTPYGVYGHTDFYLPLFIKNQGIVNQLQPIFYQYNQKEHLLEGRAL